MKKCVIYTCIVGSYDELQQPAAVDPDFDFVCFVGKGEKSADRNGVWELREFDCGPDDPRLVSRYPKMHPHVLLPEYEASVWIDGNVRIMDSTIYEVTRAKLASGVLYSGVSHPGRKSLYTEAWAGWRKVRRISPWNMLHVWVWLFLHGMPFRSGLMENNLIFRRHLDPKVVRLDEMWWDRLFDLSLRDQLSFMWCLRECGIPVDYLLPFGWNTRNHPGFKYLLHK